jgi:hypothetical protein
MTPTAMLSRPLPEVCAMRLIPNRETLCWTAFALRTLLEFMMLYFDKRR